MTLEAAAHLLTPLVSKVGWRDQEDSCHLWPSMPELRQDEPCLDRLPEADLVGDQEPVVSGLEELDQRLELVRIEIRSRRRHA